jgi:hypothetical protein
MTHSTPALGCSHAVGTDKNDVSADTRAPALRPYAVTYWTTVECGNQATHIPMDSNNVVGLGKMVFNVPARS